MRVTVAGFDRSVHSSTYPAVADAIRWLRNGNYIVHDVKRRDDEISWPEDGSPSSGCRNIALLSDILEVYNSDAICMMPSWESFPEAQAAYAAAVAMKKQILNFPDTAFAEKTWQEH